MIVSHQGVRRLFVAFIIADAFEHDHTARRDRYLGASFRVAPDPHTLDEQ